MSLVSGWLPARLERAVPAAQTGRILFLRVPGWPGNQAGQHLDLRLTAEDGYQAVRSYSIASVGEGDLVELAVDELPDGEVSPYLVTDMQPGDDLEVRGPIGAYFVWTPAEPSPIQLIAGGSGVVPLVAIARAHARAGATTQMRLLTSVREPDDAFYRDELAGLADEDLRVDWVYTRRTPPGWARPAGRLDATALRELAIPAADDPIVYVCGPTGFVEAASALLLAGGHRAERVKTERFGGA